MNLRILSLKTCVEIQVFLKILITEGVEVPDRILLRRTMKKNHCINYFRKMKNNDSRRQSKMYFVSVYFLSFYRLKEKKCLSHANS